nr:glycine cleavage system protein H [Acetomicrobium hydrogeniformans]
MVRTGANLKEGDPIGMKPNSQEIVRSPVSGLIKFITFDSDTHTLIVTIKEN